jgi:hypothetical protein
VRAGRLRRRVSNTGAPRRRLSPVQNEATAAAGRAAAELRGWQRDAAGGLPPLDAGEVRK